MVLESTGAQNTVQKVRKLALVGIVPNHVFFCPIQQSVLPTLSVRSERVWCRRFRIGDPAANSKLGFTRVGVSLHGLGWYVYRSARPTLTWRRMCEPQKPARTGFGTEPSYSPLQLRWFRPKPGARRLLRFARAASRESRPRSVPLPAKTMKTDSNPCKH